MAEKQEDEGLLMAPGPSPPVSSPEAEAIKPLEDAESPRTVTLSGPPAAAASGPAAEEAAVTDERISDVNERSSGAAAGPLEPKLVAGSETREVDVGQELCEDDADRLFLTLFGKSISDEILLRWTNQGIRFSSDPATCMGLVQNEGGPCGVLAAIQAFVLKYLLFFPKELDKSVPKILGVDFGQRSVCQRMQFEEGDFSAFTEDRRTIALLLSMVEILFLCGSNNRAGIAIIHVPGHQSEDRDGDCQRNEMLYKALEGLSVSDLRKHLRVIIYTSRISAFHRLEAELPLFRSKMGALLFLISALLSRGLEFIQSDRDDPSLPLITTPFGHASQEIVNLLLCGKAVPNVFDGQNDLGGGGMLLKGIPGSVEVGFLTLLESLHYCKVGHFLKRPRWPIWVVGGETHYTVLFALDTTVQEETVPEERSSKIREAFNHQDQSGGGGFINLPSFHEVLRETNINMPSWMVHSLSYTGFVLWSEFWQALVQMDTSLGGTGGLVGKEFDIYHLNGITQPVSHGTRTAEGEAPLRHPRLCKLHVSVTPNSSEEEVLMLDVMPSASGGTLSLGEVGNLAEPSLHTPLVDCIRTRWPRATCSWVGDPPCIN